MLIRIEVFAASGSTKVTSFRCFLVDFFSVSELPFPSQELPITNSDTIVFNTQFQFNSLLLTAAATNQPCHIIFCTGTNIY